MSILKDPSCRYQLAMLLNEISVCEKSLGQLKIVTTNNNNNNLLLHQLQPEADVIQYM